MEQIWCFAVTQSRFQDKEGLPPPHMCPTGVWALNSLLPSPAGCFLKNQIPTWRTQQPCKNLPLSCDVNIDFFLFLYQSHYEEDLLSSELSGNYFAAINVDTYNGCN